MEDMTRFLTLMPKLIVYCSTIYAFATEQDTPIGEVLKMASTEGVLHYISFISRPLPIF